MMTKKLLSGGAALLLAGCEGSNPVSTPLSQIAGPDVALRGGAAVAHGTFSTPSGTGQRVVTLHALQTPSGEVNGGYRIDITSTGAFFEVAASCVTVKGNGAWVAGHITATNSPAIRVGTVSYFYMFDNGKDEPSTDRVSTARINDAVARDVEFCTALPTLLPLLPQGTGDIKIN